MELLGQMMHTPMLLSSILEQAARHSADVEIVSRRVEGDTHRYTYRDCHARSMQLAQALLASGIEAGDRVGTLAWNGYRHMELYYGVSGIGAVCHTINPRLFPEQIVFIVNHARDRFVFFDASFLPLVEQIAALCPHVEKWIMLCDETTLPRDCAVPFASYEALIAPHTDRFAWPRFNEERAALLCYTSGTTGDPKGVLYSHRSITLMCYGSALPDSLALSATETIAPVVPMFHVNAWGIPFSATLVGAKLVLPGAKLDGESLATLFEEEGVTMSAGVPTVWLGFVDYMRRTGRTTSTFKRAVVGGAACPPHLAGALGEVGVKAVHAWGMTELSPLGTVCSPSRGYAAKSEAARAAIDVKQGRAVPGIDLKIVGGDGGELPWDGTSAGDLMARGHWVAERYFGRDESPLVDGWFPTGDVATIDPDGYMHITDRSKDVIKSGGEWISSIELENIAMSHPEIAKAACIACAHPKWDERPLIVAVRREGSAVDAGQLLDFYSGKVAKWCVPDDVVFVDDLPLTATGKLQKMALRQRFGGHFTA
ncbi:long-chain-fatty-acid--CoA ligase [Caballeronia arationis]|jgi:fatty-acyl-CoA synthase|uniref:Acyl-CoA synthetase (AMP-forming)/AMP-acid ligase II n=1 Tax=Caballeronia arationis TaxID=1777142 RepID=A0A7Z7I5M6_9BURK|nr:3-(methylthio)propionyl-CoA ligase [Caballeronia arationis]SAL05697.1 long-chain-fatty-acid--CoA ligase [Caballeronia arationis]SOE65206.1 Acyl-CoA synthetase (AMP-forming)/AMP-acid ligase II [Caballeronia arationis]